MVVHGDVTTWKPSPRHWPFVMGIYRWPTDSLHKGPVMWTFDVSIFLACTICRKTVQLTVIGDKITSALRHCNGHGITKLITKPKQEPQQCYSWYYCGSMNWLKCVWWRVRVNSWSRCPFVAKPLFEAVIDIGLSGANLIKINLMQNKKNSIIRMLLKSMYMIPVFHLDTYISSRFRWNTHSVDFHDK